MNHGRNIMAEAKKDTKKTTKAATEKISKDEELAQQFEATEADHDDIAAVDNTNIEAIAADSTDEPKLAKAGKRSQKAVTEAEAESERKAKAALKEPVEKSKRVIHTPNPLKAHGKNWRKASELVDRTKLYDLEEAIKLAQKTSTTKFDSTIELHLNLGVDPRQADQMIRGTLSLPSGTGKELKVAVIAPADKQEAAKKAGADLVGDADLLAKIEKGQIGFDVLIATPDMMPSLGKVAKVLGPKGLMPNPKSGTVTANVAEAVKEAKAGKIEYRIDKQAIVHQAIGKASFTADQLLANAQALIRAIAAAKPSGSKGTYLKSVTITSTMGPGIKLDVASATAKK